MAETGTNSILAYAWWHVKRILLQAQGFLPGLTGCATQGKPDTVTSAPRFAGTVRRAAPPAAARSSAFQTAW